MLPSPFGGLFGFLSRHQIGHPSALRPEPFRYIFSDFVRSAGINSSESPSSMLEHLFLSTQKSVCNIGRRTFGHLATKGRSNARIVRWIRSYPASATIGEVMELDPRFSAILTLHMLDQ
jgi:hypothetical protein